MYIRKFLKWTLVLAAIIAFKQVDGHIEMATALNTQMPDTTTSE